MKNLFQILLIVIVIGGLIFGGCAAPAPAPTPQPSPTPAPAPSQPPIKIGILSPMTGPMALSGIDLVNGSTFGFDEAGRQVAGRKIEVILEDDGSQTQMAMDKVRKLVEQDKVCMVLGPLAAGVKMAVASYTSKVGIPHLPFGPCPWAIKDSKWTFTVEGSEPSYAYTMANYAYNQMGKRKVTVLTEDTVAGHSFLDAFISGFKDAGGQIIQEQYSPWPCQDFAPYLSNLKDADAIVAWYEGQDSVIFLNQMNEFGIRKRMPLVAPFHGAFFLLPLLNKALKPESAAALVGERGPTEYTNLLPSDINKQFVAAYKKKMGITPAEGDAIAYESARVALQALTATGGDTTPEKLRKAIAAVDIQVPSGRVRFDPETNFAIRTMYIFQIDKVEGSYNWVPIYLYENVPASGKPTPPGRPF